MTCGLCSVEWDKNLRKLYHCGDGVCAKGVCEVCQSDLVKEKIDHVNKSGNAEIKMENCWQETDLTLQVNFARKCAFCTETKSQLLTCQKCKKGYCEPCKVVVEAWWIAREEEAKETAL